jgi:hypothetical protein
MGKAGFDKLRTASEDLSLGRITEAQYNDIERETYDADSVDSGSESLYEFVSWFK